MGNSRGGSASAATSFVPWPSYRPRGGQACRERAKTKELLAGILRRVGRPFRKGSLAWAKRDALWSNGYEGGPIGPRWKGSWKRGSNLRNSWSKGRADDHYPRSSGSRVVEGFVNNHAAIRRLVRQGHQKERETSSEDKKRVFLFV